MGLPFKPEPLDALKKRFPKAFYPVYNIQKIAFATAGQRQRPDCFRKHIFDFEDGIRMMACAEWGRRKEKRELCFHLHISFAAQDHVPAEYANTQIYFLLLAFVGTRKQLDMVPSQGNSVIHFFYEHEPSRYARLSAMLDAGEITIPDRRADLGSF